MILESTAVGGLMGLLTPLFQNVAGYFQTRLEMKKRQQEMDHEARMMPLKLEAAKEEAAWKVFDSSVTGAAKEASNENLPWWASAVLVLTRPALTLMLVAGTVAAALWLVPPYEQKSIIDQMIDLTGTAVGWWFASRTMSRFAAKK